MSIGPDASADRPSRLRRLIFDVMCLAAVLAALFALSRLGENGSPWWLLLVGLGVVAVFLQLLVAPTRWRERRDPSRRTARQAHSAAPPGTPTDDPALRPEIVLRALRDKQRWQPTGRCPGTIVEALHLGGGTDTTANVYLVVDVERAGRIERIATGESVNLAHLGRLSGPVTVLVDDAHPRRIGIDWSTPAGPG